MDVINVVYHLDVSLSIDVYSPFSLPILGMCGKPKFGSNFVFKKTEPSKHLTCAQTVVP